MEVLLPENISDITLRQYKKFHALGELSDEALAKRKIEIFTGISRRRVNQIKKKDYDYMLNQIDLALSQDSEFVNRFKMNGVEYGFIPNFDNISAGEWGDLSRYNTDIETLHNLMAILFRPIKDEDGIGNYQIVSYQGTDKHAELMLDTPMNIVQGALVFFYNLAKELQTAIQAFTQEELRRVKKHPIFSSDGDGTQLFMN